MEEWKSVSSLILSPKNKYSCNEEYESEADLEKEELAQNDARALWEQFVESNKSISPD